MSKQASPSTYAIFGNFTIIIITTLPQVTTWVEQSDCTTLRHTMRGRFTWMQGALEWQRWSLSILQSPRYNRQWARSVPWSSRHILCLLKLESSLPSPAARTCQHRVSTEGEPGRYCWTDWHTLCLAVRKKDRIRQGFDAKTLFINLGAAAARAPLWAGETFKWYDRYSCKISKASFQ